MIYIMLRGNMGNQMFIYAFAKKIKYENPLQDVCLVTYLNRHNGMDFKLDCFKLDTSIKIDDKYSPPWYANEKKNVIRVIRRLVPNFFFKIESMLNVYIWKNQTYLEIPKILDKNYIFSGYWQIPSYFNEYKDMIVKDFIIKEKFGERYKKFEKIINLSHNPVCVSYRRGDYMSKKNKKVFMVCDEEYYRNAIKKLEEYVKEYTIFVFSDDIEWCESNLIFKEKVYFEPKGLKQYETFKLITLCKHFILSNSSFAWWGQYLGKNRDSKVIAPKRWYNNIECEIYETDWIRV